MIGLTPSNDYYSAIALLMVYILMNCQGQTTCTLAHSVRTSRHTVHQDVPSTIWHRGLRIITQTVSPTAVRIIWQTVNDESARTTSSAAGSEDHAKKSMFKSLTELYMVGLFTDAEPVFPPGCNSSTEANPTCTPVSYRLIKGHPERFPVTVTYASVPLARPTATFYKDKMKYSGNGVSEYNQLAFARLRPGRQYNFMVQKVANIRMLPIQDTEYVSSITENKYDFLAQNDSHEDGKHMEPTEPSTKWIGLGSAMTFKEPGVLYINAIKPTGCTLMFYTTPRCSLQRCGTVVQLLFRYTSTPYLLEPVVAKDVIMSKHPANDVSQAILGGTNLQERMKNMTKKSKSKNFVIDHQIANLSPNSVYYYNFLILYNTNFIYMQKIGRFTTSKGVPDPIDHVQITENEAGSYSIEWPPPRNKGGVPIQSYVLQYRLVPSGEPKDRSESWHQITIGEQEHYTNNYTFTLKPVKCTNCKFSVRVAANNSIGIGNFSEITTTNTGGKLGNRKVIVAITTVAAIAGIVFLFMGATSLFCYRKKLESAKEEIKAQLPPIILPKDLDSLPKITSNQTKVLEKLGEGNFGTVYAGLAFGLIKDAVGGGKAQKVALKMLKDGATVEQRSEIVNEALTMRNMHHPNILGLLGLCLEDQRFWLVLELMDSGNLSQYLKDLRPQGAIPSQVSLRDLGRMIKQVIAGAVYVESLGYTHRDLAARNILVNGRDPEQCHLKIADFGLTRGLYEAQYYRMSERSLIPVRWTAPEVFQTKVFDFKSDTWAFGMVVWEIVSLGQTPYSIFTEQEVIRFVLDGGTEVPPENCGQVLHQIMLQCWEHDSFQRKSLSEISRVVESTIINDLNTTEIVQSEKCYLHSPYCPRIIPLERKILKKPEIKHLNTATTDQILNGQTMGYTPHDTGPLNPAVIRQTAHIEEEVAYTEPLQLNCVTNPVHAGNHCNSIKAASSNCPETRETLLLDYIYSGDLSPSKPEFESGASPAPSDPLQPNSLGYVDPQQPSHIIPTPKPGPPTDPEQKTVHNRLSTDSIPKEDNTTYFKGVNNKNQSQAEHIIQYGEAEALADTSSCNSWDKSSIDNPIYICS